MVRSLLILTLFGLGCFAFGAEVVSLDSDAPAPAPPSGGVTLPALDDEVARAKAAEKVNAAAIADEAAERKTEHDAMKTMVDEGKTGLATETGLREKLATDNTNAMGVIEQAAKKSETDAATEKTAVDTQIAGAIAQTKAEVTTREDALSKQKQELTAKVEQADANLKAFETQLNEKRASEQTALQSRDQNMVTTVNSLKSNLQTETSNRNQMVKQVNDLVTGLTTKVTALTLKVTALQGGAQSGAQTSAAPPGSL